METGYIPPNINFNSTRKELKGIVEGRMKVVVDKTQVEDDNALMGKKISIKIKFTIYFLIFSPKASTVLDLGAPTVTWYYVGTVIER